MQTLWIFFLWKEMYGGNKIEYCLRCGNNSRIDKNHEGFNFKTGNFTSFETKINF